MKQVNNEDVLRRVVEYAGGLAAKPERKLIEVRRPEIISMPNSRSPMTVYIPRLPAYCYAALESDTILDIDAVNFVASEHVTGVWITTHSELDTSELLHPVLKVYGYWRYYRCRVWMPDKEFYERFPPEEEVPEEPDKED